MNIKYFLSRFWKPIVNVIMVIYCAKMLYLTFADVYFDLKDINRCYGSEFLINYQGGFVRRGLLGEVIFHLCNLTGWHPMVFVAIICIACFVVLSVFFLCQFKKNELSWWIIPLSIMLGFFNIIHKDALLLLCLVASLCVLKSKCRDVTKLVTINILSIAAILIHESYFFICVPLLCLIIVRSRYLAPGLAFRLLSLIPVLFSFFVVCVYHGDADTANSILASWKTFYNGLTLDDLPRHPEYDVPGPSLGAISWSVDTALQMHTSINFLYKSLGIPGYISRPLLLLVVYYFTTNYNYAFSNPPLSNNRRRGACVPYKKNSYFPPILLFQFVSLLPLFTVLSCDTCRISCYWLASTYIVYLLMPEEELAALFPRFYVSWVDRMQTGMNKIVRPSLPLMVILLLFIGVPKNGSDIVNAFCNSAIMGLHWLLLIPYHLIF